MLFDNEYYAQVETDRKIQSEKDQHQRKLNNDEVQKIVTNKSLITLKSPYFDMTSFFYDPVLLYIWAYDNSNLYNIVTLHKPNAAVFNCVKAYNNVITEYATQPYNNYH